jgi:GntR family transcriptional regulator, transcriptional repressor for pyruvate dehydrogenase complex
MITRLRVTIIQTEASPVRELIDFIRREGYGVGDRLPPIRQLSETLGFGRNAVRDALLEAQTLGFVKIEPRLGAFVQDPEPQRGSDSLGPALERVFGHVQQNLFHLLDARLLVESELAAEAARSRRLEDLLPLLRNVLLIRDPREVVASYVRARA